MLSSPRASRIFWLLFLAALAPPALVAQEKVRSDPPAAVPKATLPPAWVSKLHWRSIGPANMGGRITAIAVNEQDPSTWWVATASGGLLKTVNNGITFEHQFDHEKTVSIGDVQVAPSHPNIVWVGTGEANPRNSVSFGDGVYKSTDGGKSWKNMGLEESFQIGRIAIDPRNPDVVYVGALGRLWGKNKERGLFKTTDGGKSWQKILYVDDHTGVIDVRLQPGHPDTLLAATYERRRDIYSTNDPSQKIGKGSALYRSTDGGGHWKKITKGLPPGKLGRLGIDFYLKNPKIVFMLVETGEMGKGPKDAGYLGLRGEDADVGARILKVIKGGPAMKAGLKEGDIVVAAAGQTLHSYQDLVAAAAMRKAGEKLKLEISRERKGQELAVVLGRRPKGGAGRGSRNRFFGSSRRFGTRLGGQQANIQKLQGPKGYRYGGLFRSDDGGQSWTRINSVNPRPMYFSQVRVDPEDEQWVYVLGVFPYRSKDGGRHFERDYGRGVHADQHALWVDPRDGRHQILGCDGGIYVTYDRGAHWDHLNHVAIGQFYHVAVGPRRNYRVYGGLQDNGSWGGPSRSKSGAGPINQDWIRIGGGDGFVCWVDQEDPDQIYYESQNGSLGRRNLRTGERGRIRPKGERRRFFGQRPAQKPQAHPKAAKNPGEAGGRGRAHKKGPARRRKRTRFNWNTPFVLSHHNSRIYYVAGDHVFRSLDRGRTLKKISPEITRTKRGSATALAESPRTADVLYVGTDDGALWGTRDGGHTWAQLYAFASPLARQQPATNKQERPASAKGKPAGFEKPLKTSAIRLGRPAHWKKKGAGGRQTEPARRFLRGAGEGAKKVPESGVANVSAPLLVASLKKSRGTRPLSELLPGPRRVSSLEPSHYATGRVYATFDGHRSDDDLPHLMASQDFGESWRALDGDLPEEAGPALVIREDIKDQNLLYLGTEFGIYVSIDRGQSWSRLTSNLPTVAVRDLAIHPMAGEIVAATHGRSLWILDVTALRQFNQEALQAPFELFQPAPGIIWRQRPSRGDGLRRFVGENPLAGVEIYYALKHPAGDVQLSVLDREGKTVRKLKVTEKGAGLHKLVWDLRRKAPPSHRRIPARFRRFRRGPRVHPGFYRLRLVVDGEEALREVEVMADPDEKDSSYLEYQEASERALLEEEGRDPDDS